MCYWYCSQLLRSHWEWWGLPLWLMTKGLASSLFMSAKVWFTSLWCVSSAIYRRNMDPIRNNNLSNYGDHYGTGSCVAYHAFQCVHPFGIIGQLVVPLGHRRGVHVVPTVDIIVVVREWMIVEGEIDFIDLVNRWQQCSIMYLRCV